MQMQRGLDRQLNITEHEQLPLPPLGKGLPKSTYAPAPDSLIHIPSYACTHTLSPNEREYDSLVILRLINYSVQNFALTHKPLSQRN